jgi:hypothetical protein
LQLVRRFRLPAVFCAFAVLVCELMSRPFAEMGICDDWSYIHTAEKLASTGHFIYSGWAPALQFWQAYIALVLIKLFGFSMTTVRMSTLLVALALAFVLQRTMARANISERNATIGTLALVLSPLYLMLSVTFMTDIHGLFATVLCLYGCIRALQSSTSRATIGWLCFAIATNAICGTSRQIAWLGILVMVPSTLWLLRAQRRVFLAGAAANLAGAVFILLCLHWLKQQPYSVPEHLFVRSYPLAKTFGEFIYAFMDVPLLLLPIAALFLPELRKLRPRILAILSALLLCYLFLALYPSHIRSAFPLEPMPGGLGEWVNIHAIFEYLILKGTPPIFLNRGTQILLTIASFGGAAGLFASLLRSRTRPPALRSTSISWNQLGVLLVPFTLAYLILLVSRAATAGIHDRYLLGILVFPLITLVRYYEEQIQPRLPLASVLMVAIMAIYSIVVTHNMFALYRARVAIAAQLRASGIPDTSVDNGWEYNSEIELQHAAAINDFRMAIPAKAYVPTPPLPANTCPMNEFDETPHVHPLYGISFDPKECYGPAPFAPVHYSRWLASKPGTLYVVRYLPPSSH